MRAPMGLLDLFRPRPPARSITAIARDLAEAVFALHPSALDQVVLKLGPGRVVVVMEVPATDPRRQQSALPDPALQTAKISSLCAELGGVLRSSENELTVMRDRVAWMPAVIPFNPPLP